ncbi:MAG: DinB family protein [Tepidisphaeraceae bacterium]
MSDPLDILLAHDRWATGQILSACETLTPEQFHRRFDIGPGSLHDAATHILAAMRIWGDLLAGREERPRLEGTTRTLAELRKLLDEIAADLAISARAHPLDQTVSRIREGKIHTYTRGAVLAHVTTHGMHHRAQCLNMLRHLGVKPLPPVSVAEWTRLVDSGA